MINGRSRWFGDGLPDKRDHLVEAALVVTDVDELSREDRDDVGLAGLAAERVGRFGETFGRAEIASQQRVQDPVERDSPPLRGVWHSFGALLADRGVSAHRRQVASLERGQHGGVVGDDACGDVAKRVGEPARFGRPFGAQVECPGHGDRNVRPRKRGDERGGVAAPVTGCDRFLGQSESLVEV